MEKHTKTSQGESDCDGYRYAATDLTHSSLLPTVVTLGPSGTCSETVVLRSIGNRLPQAQVLLFDTYEEGANFVVRQESDLLVVAAAYPHLNNLVFGSPRQLEIVDAFVHNTPAIVIASSSPHDTLDVLAAMPAPAPLAHERYPCAEMLTVNSNAAAANAVVDGRARGCVTTDIAAQQRGLCIRHSFGVESMAWVVMQKRN